MQSAETEQRLVSLSGDFSTLFDIEDYQLMFKSPDEITIILRAHLILEEFLNLWCSKITNTKDLFSGSVISFQVKLTIAKNLGLDAEYASVLERFNAIRNKFSHVRKHKITTRDIDSLRIQINSLSSQMKLQPCEKFHVYGQGLNEFGEKIETTHNWEESAKVQILILFVQLMLKITQYMQSSFIARGIKYDLIVTPM